MASMDMKRSLVVNQMARRYLLLDIVMFAFNQLANSTKKRTAQQARAESGVVVVNWGSSMLAKQLELIFFLSVGIGLVEPASVEQQQNTQD